LPIDERDFGKFQGATERALQAIEEQLKRGNQKFDGFDKRLRALESHNPNGWRSAVRPGAIGVGGASALHVVWEIVAKMVAGG